MDRRTFIKLGLSTIPLIGCKNYIYKALDERDKEDGKFLFDLQKFVIQSDVDAKFKIKEKPQEVKSKGMGIIVEDKYFSLNHIYDFYKKIPLHTPFGTMYLMATDASVKVSIEGKELEQLVTDEKNDIKIFKTECKKQFPLEYRTEVEYGERVAVIGNPASKGMNCRIGYITDLDGVDFPDMNYKNGIGTDIGVIGGDSGTPVISMSDKKLLGLMGLHFGPLGYFQPIKNFLKNLK